jgi:hypothetical protein
MTSVGASAAGDIGPTPSSPHPTGTIKVNVKDLNDETFLVAVEPSDTVFDIKCKITSLHSESIEPARQKLIWRGRVLADDNANALSVGLEHGTTVHLVKRMSPGSAAPHAPMGVAADIPSTYQRGAYTGAQPHADEQRPLMGGAAAGTGAEAAQRQQINADMNRMMMAIADMPGYDDLSQSVKLIQMFSLIDCLLLIMFCLWGAFIFLLFLPLAMCGYYGAKRLNRTALGLYGLFIVLSITFRVILCVAYPSALMIILTAISVLLELYVFRKLVILWRVIPYLDPMTREHLLQYASIDNAF